MENNIIFVSNILRNQEVPHNNLRELIDITPAKPINNKVMEHLTCDFKPKTDKLYVPKRQPSKFKVKTVSELRNQFERDIYSDLPSELQKQQNILLRKIRFGSSTEGNTKTLALNIMKSKKPISRTAWQMISNINPENCTHATQYVLYNGKNIQVNGSKGGKNKYISRYDLGPKKTAPKNKKPMVASVKLRTGLLKRSLAVNFKPGPLRKKKYLDDSYQKYNIGNIELVNLPKVVLEIQPTHKVSLEPSITTFLHNLRDQGGTISKTWAEFAVSMLGCKKDSNVSQVDNEFITFDLSYKYDQRVLLMREDLLKSNDDEHSNESIVPVSKNEDVIVLSEVKSIVENIITSVEINLNQDLLYSGVDDPRDICQENLNNSNSNLNSTKTKRKYGELERLDVTVINLSHNTHDSMEKCQKTFCTLGCICGSLNYNHVLRNHCGRPECMFKCNCNYSKYKAIDSLDEGECSELLNGLLNLNEEMSCKLSKEEKKFHQTVILTDKKSILLKSKKRNWKTSKRYADFYSNMNLKNEFKSKLILTVPILKLNCENIEPWCLLHNMYKCFCEGKFTQTVTTITNEENTNMNNSEENVTKECNKTTHVNESVNSLELRTYSNRRLNKQIDCVELQKDISNSCARSKSYKGRKYNDEYYSNANNKILELEKNDKGLQNRMLSLMHNCSQEFFTNESELNVNLIDPIDKDHIQIFTTEIVKQQLRNSPINENKLVKWLENSYKQFKRRIEQGAFIITLDPPKNGKLAMYPWDFILDRYKERKNLFMVTKEKPFRIFMAINRSHPYFVHCINIDEIRFAEINNYPLTVKTLLTNASDLKDSFCILRGLAFSWELIGSVTKISDKTSKSETHSGFTNDSELLHTFSSDEKDDNISPSLDDSQTKEKSNVNLEINKIHIEENSSSSSKWFVMTLENDFTEIQFFRRGFFVRYESIIKAIGVARISGKTVRLSSQKCLSESGNPHFGIYAIPNTKVYCVFVGPYETNEQLGIETIKTVRDERQDKRTRGIWIITKKVDNFKVIDNPLLYMPHMNFDTTYQNSFIECTNLNIEEEALTNLVPEQPNVVENSPIKSDENSVSNHKLIKPIRIRKTNGFYHLAPNGLLKQIPLTNSDASRTSPQALTSKSKEQRFNDEVVNDIQNTDNIIPLITLDDKCNELKPIKEPVTETAAQINNVDPASQVNIKRPERGMFILKPEEINKRVFENSMICNASTHSYHRTDTDVENFLATSKECCAPSDDILVISDDENEQTDVLNTDSIQIKEVWIKCLNVKNLGWIPGRINEKNNISFEFPGFKYTEFYPQREAFLKINQVLIRKVYVPKNLKLIWEIQKRNDNEQGTNILQASDLGPDVILTKRGLISKAELNPKDIAFIKLSEKNFNVHIISAEAIEFSKQSKTLEDEGHELWNIMKTKRKKNLDILQSISNDERKEITNQLLGIMSDNE